MARFAETRAPRKVAAWLRGRSAEFNRQYWAVADLMDEAAAIIDQQCDALAAAARQGGDVKQAPAESPQSGGDQPQRPTDGGSNVTRY